VSGPPEVAAVRTPRGLVLRQVHCQGRVIPQEGVCVPARAPDRNQPTTRSAVRTGLAVALVAALSTACAGAHVSAGGGEANKPAAQILADAQAAAQRADSVHISGTVDRVGGGAADAPATATLDLVLTSSGDGRETITGTGENIDLIKVGQLLFVKGLSSPDGGYQRLSVQDPRAAPLVAQLDKKSVFGQLIRPGAQPTVTGTASVAGQPAVALVPGGGTGVLYVADDPANPYPLKVETTPTDPTTGAATPGPAGALTFTDWNAHAVIAPPA
jgi:hypothetical protein